MGGPMVYRPARFDRGVAVTTIELFEEHKRRAETDKWIDRCIKGETGKPLPNVANVIIALQAVYPEHFGFDEMARHATLLKPLPRLLEEEEDFSSRPVSDIDIVRLQDHLQHLGLKRVSAETVHAAVDKCADDCRFHPVRQYLESRLWDGSPRLDQFLARYFGTESNAYTQA